MSRKSKIMAAVLVAVVGAMIGLFTLFNGEGGPQAQAVDQTKLRTESSHTLGTGPVTVVEFGDYQCPACAAAHPALKQLAEQNGSDVTFVFRNYPLTQIHRNAVASAKAAEAADRQGKFWEMHNKIYENQKAWENSGEAAAVFAGYAQELGMNVDQFNSDVADQAIKDRIDADVADGNAVEVAATPTVFINGVKYTGSYTYDALKKAVDDAKNK